MSIIPPASLRRFKTPLSEEQRKQNVTLVWSGTAERREKYRGAFLVVCCLIFGIFAKGGGGGGKVPPTSPATRCLMVLVAEILYLLLAVSHGR